MESLGPDPIANDDWDKKLLAMEYLQAWNFAGGAGLPVSMLERGARSLISERGHGDKGRAIASGLGGANVGAVYDTAVLGNDVFTALMKWSSGKLSKSDFEKLKRDLVNYSAHVPLLNAPLGIGGALRRGVNTPKGKANTAPGWSGVGQEGATWNPARGVTSPASERQRLEDLEDWRERDARERENAESSWGEEAS
jgi:hypothetical protein